MRRNFIALLGVMSVFAVLAQPSIEWSKTYGGVYNDGSSKMLPTNDGGHIIVGYASSADGDVSQNYGGSDVWLFKIDHSGQLLWEKNLGGTANDYAVDIVEANDGGFIIAGSSNSNDIDVSGRHGTSTDVWMLKTNNTGTIVWQKMFGGSGSDFPLKMQKTPDGGVVVVGSTDSNNGDIPGNNGYTDGFAAKFSDTGAVLWTKVYGGDKPDSFYDIADMDDGGFLFVGGGYSDIPGQHGNADVWVFKTDAAGEVVWKKGYGGTAYDYGFCITKTLDGDYVIAGRTSSQNGDVINYIPEHQGTIDYWVFLMNSVGDIIWEKALGDLGDDFPQKITTAADGSIIVGGYSSLSNGNPLEGFNGGTDVLLYNLSSSGDLLWTKVIGGYDDDFLRALLPKSDGSFYAALTTYSTSVDITGNHGGNDVLLVKIAATVGTKDVSDPENMLAVFPNPASEVITVTLPLDAFPAMVSISDAKGKIVLTAANTARLTVSSLPVGVYWISVLTTSGRLFTGKFTKGN